MNRIIGFRITGRKWSLIILMFNPILCDNSFYVFFVFWPPLRETLGLEFQFFFFFLKQHCPRTILLSQKHSLSSSTRINYAQRLWQIYTAGH